VRKLISDFAIILAILIFCGVDALVGVETPKLIVPSEFKVNFLFVLSVCYCKEMFLLMYTSKIATGWTVQMLGGAVCLKKIVVLTKAAFI